MNLTSAQKIQLKDKMAQYRKNPDIFCREILQVTLQPWQKDAADLLATSTHISVRSGKGVGKTAFEAWMILWFLFVHPFSKVIATAPTESQLKKILWAEIAKWIAKSTLLQEIFKVTKQEIFVRGYDARWFATQRTATHATNMQGFHEDNMLFIVDEASGVADDIITTILDTLSGGNNKILMCGNPNFITGIFHLSHTEARDEWETLHVSARDSSVTSKENHRKIEAMFGKDSNVVRVGIDGDFPFAEDDVFIPLHLIDDSIKAGLDYKAEGPPQSIHIGCDVARFGDDKTVIGYKVDSQVAFKGKQQGQDTMKTADKIIELGESLRVRYQWPGKIPVKVDDGGVGGGVVDRLRQIKRNSPERFAWLEVIPVKFGVRIKNKHYHDSTSYMTGVVKKLLMPYDEAGKLKPIELILPNDDNLAAQLSSRKYKVTEASKIQVESKDAMKKRGLPSPDEADCVLLLCLPVRLKE